MSTRVPCRLPRFVWALLPGLLLACLPGCRVDLPLAGAAAEASAEAPFGEPQDGAALESVAAGQPLPRVPGVDPGPYAEDARWPAFLRAWPDRVDAAVDRLGVVTGLTFASTGRPSVVLRAFRDETRTHEIRAEILQGRRRSVVHINLEPLLAGVHDTDRVLLRALAEAAFQDAARRHGPVPRWFVVLAGTVAAGDTDQRLLALRRHALRAGYEVLKVDPDDPAAAEATGLAAITLLASRGEPDLVRRTILFVADGDDAGVALGRLVREADGAWTRPARLSLGERLGSVDPAPWVLLAKAEEAAEEMGRAGLEDVLPAELPPEVADELLVLRARTLSGEGQYGQARQALRALSPGAPARLRDPAAALALRIDVESRPGGDARLARRLALQLDRDHPRSAARARLRDAHPLLGMQEDPQRWLAIMRERVAERGVDTLDLRTLERYVRMLVMDHRAGAAVQVLDRAGERAKAPELEAVHQLVDDAQRMPSAAAQGIAAARVRAWLARPEKDTARDVRETGRAAAAALLAVLDGRDATRAPEALRLLAGAAGPVATVALVRGRWPEQPSRVARELPMLSLAVDAVSLEGALEGAGDDPLLAASLADTWEQVTFGLSRRWLALRPAFLQEARHEAFAVRRDALVAIGLEAPREITPALVAYGLSDRAALLRREAAALAGIAGFRALARRGLEDEAGLVREEALRAIARIEGRDAVALLVERLRTDTAREVRAAAATALLQTAPDDPRAIDALLATQVAEEPRLRDAIGARLAELDPVPVVEGIARGWERAVTRREPNRGYLFRTALMFERLTASPLGYYPGAAHDELRTMLGTMRTWLRRQADPDRAGQPTGRKR